MDASAQAGVEANVGRAAESMSTTSALAALEWTRAGASALVPAPEPSVYVGGVGTQEKVLGENTSSCLQLGRQHPD